jgi:hypothetical protein
MNMHMRNSSDDTSRCPEPVGDCDDQADTRQLATEAEDADPEEEGYGYGV